LGDYKDSKETHDNLIQNVSIKIPYVISASNWHTIGLKKDGTVVATGNNDDGQCDISSWKDIIIISAGGNHTVGLKKNGTVVAMGNNYDGQCNVSDWKDIVAVSAGGLLTVKTIL